MPHERCGHPPTAVSSTRSTRAATVGRLKLPGRLRGVAWAFGSVWVGSQTGTAPSGSTADTGHEGRVGQRGLLFAASTDAMWVTSVGSNTAARIDPRTNRVVAVVRVGPSPATRGCSDGTIWVPIRSVTPSP